MDRTHDRLSDRQPRIRVKKPNAVVQDPLTGLPDRSEFVRWLADVLDEPGAAQRGVVAIAINLDGFRRINTLHGSAAGDHVLRVTADRLASGIRSGIDDAPGDAAAETDFLARLSA